MKQAPTCTQEITELKEITLGLLKLLTKVKQGFKEQKQDIRAISEQLDKITKM